MTDYTSNLDIQPREIRDGMTVLERIAHAVDRIADNTSRKAEDRLAITETTWPMPPFLPNYAKQILGDMDWLIGEIKKSKPPAAHIAKLEFHRDEFAQWVKEMADFDKHEKADD